MKKILLGLIFITLSNICFGQVADHVVIAEVFGGGGNPGAPYLYDYIVLYNPTASSVNVSGWSVQYANAAANSQWFRTNLIGSIPAHSYYLIQELAGAGGNGIILPYYPDVISSIGISPTNGGKVALVNNQITFTSDPTLPNASIIDFVGFSPSASLYEGTGPANAIDNITSIRRKNNNDTSLYNYGLNGSGWDTDTNSTNFYSQGSLLLIPNYPLSSSYLANHVVIAEVYGGGGETGATYTNDYVVLYNSSSIGISLIGWSLQYATSVGTFWNSMNLSGSIPSNSYFIIELGSGGSNGTGIPGTPDLSNPDLNIDISNGKLALVRNQTTLTGNNPITANSGIVDFVGYGASANGFEGTIGPASSPGNTSSIRRKDRVGNNTYGLQNGSGWDANNNSGDFYIESDILNNPPAPKVQFDHPVIAEIYSGGGNTTNSTYLYDYVALYNPTNASIDLTSPIQWTLQRELGNANGWSQVVVLSGSIGANSYYLIQGSTGGSYGAVLPVTPNVIDPYFNLQVAGSKVALVEGGSAITGINDPTVVDFVGYGTSTVNPSYEGSGPAPAPSVSQSARRKDNFGYNTYGTDGSGWDTDNNNLDFYIQSNPVPLPVELSSFSANIISRGIKLNWRTETEVQNYGFDVERKSGSEDWQKLGFIEGHGNSNVPWNYSFTDDRTEPGKYSYRLKQIDTDGKFEYSKIIDVNFGDLKDYRLNQNYPNPFNPVTTISFTLPQSSNVNLVIYNILGQEIKTLVKGFTEAGVHSVSFDASELNSGIYIYKLQAGSFSQVRKMLLLK